MRHAPLRHNTVQSIVKRALAGETYTSISKKLGISYPAVAIRMQKAGVRRRLCSKGSKWHAQAIDSFLVSHSSSIVRMSNPPRHSAIDMEWKCQDCGSEWTAPFEAIRARIERGSTQGCRGCGWGKGSVYHGLLDSLTPISAYFLGAFMARGHMKKTRGGGYVITITSDNADKIQSLANAISFKGKVGKRNSIVFWSTRIATAIIARTTDGSMSEMLRSPMAPHFTRGYFDYQGHVETVTWGRMQSNRVTFHGQKNLVSKVLKSYRLHNGADDGYLRKKGREFQFIGSRSPLRFLTWIYNHDISIIKYADDVKYGMWLHLKEHAKKLDSRKAQLLAIAREYDALIARKKSMMQSLQKMTGLTMQQIYNEMRAVSSGVTQIRHTKAKLEEIKSKIAAIKDKMTGNGMTISALYYYKNQ